jgi:hypothetical protein
MTEMVSLSWRVAMLKRASHAVGYELVPSKWELESKCLNAMKSPGLVDNLATGPRVGWIATRHSSHR